VEILQQGTVLEACPNLGALKGFLCGHLRTCARAQVGASHFLFERWILTEESHPQTEPNRNANQDAHV
jgi:hypothetical protein